MCLQLIYRIATVGVDQQMAGKLRIPVVLFDEAKHSLSWDNDQPFTEHRMAGYTFV